MDYRKPHINNTLPAQKVSFKNKDKKWKQQCVDAISTMSNGRTINGRSSWGRKQINYDLVNSIIDENDFQHILDPYGQGKSKIGNTPAKLRNINLITNKISFMKGEEMNRPFNFQVIATNGEAISAKEEQRKAMLIDAAYNMLSKELGISLEPEINPETGEETPVTFESVDRYIKYNYTDLREKWGNDLLKYLQHQQRLQKKFNDGWEHAIISAEEIYYVGITNGEPIVRTCNPLNCEFDRNPDNSRIEDGDWFREDRWMTVGQILDEFGEYLTEDEISKIEQGLVRRNMDNSMLEGFAYSESDIDSYERSNYSSRTRSNSSHYLVNHVVWKSMKKIGFVTYPDEHGNDDTGIVDETFKLTDDMKELGYSVEWTWIPEVWEGTKIADDIYVDIKPLPNQSRSMDNPRSVKLPYVGEVYNATNSVQTSIVDLLSPHQYLYITIWHRLETELAKAKGKKFVLDLAQIPKSQGWDLDKWMYMFDNVGIAVINSFEEGTEGTSTGKTSNFNQFTSIDMTLSNTINQYIYIMDKIEQLMDRIVGITPQREGQTKASETASGVQNSIIQSSVVTEPWFYVHNEVKKRVLSALIETAKFAYPGKKKLNYITDDQTRIMLEIDVEKFMDSDYGVFVSNSNRDNVILSKLHNLAEMALSSNAATLSDVAKIYRAQSAIELTREIEESENEKIQREQEQAQQQERIVQMQNQAMQEEKERERAFIAEQNQLDREAKIQEATIKTMGFDTDTQDNDIIDVVEQSKLALEQSKMSHAQADKERQRSHEITEKEKDRRLKEKEIESKERIEKLKAETALKNKTVGEK